MKLLKVEKGIGYRLVICGCGWRSMVGSDQAATLEGARHLDAVHDNGRGARDFAAQRRRRGIG